MKKIFIALFSLLSLATFAASPTFQSFTNTDFEIVGTGSAQIIKINPSRIPVGTGIPTLDGSGTNLQLRSTFITPPLTLYRSVGSGFLPMYDNTSNLVANINGAGSFVQPSKTNAGTAFWDANGVLSATNPTTLNLLGKSNETTITARGGTNATWVFEFTDPNNDSLGGVLGNGDFSLVGNFVAVKGLFAYGESGEGGVHVFDDSTFGGCQIKELADGSDDTDAATVQQIIVSDRNKKENFSPAPSVLEKVIQFDLQTYNFKPTTRTNRIVKPIRGRELKFETNSVLVTVSRPEKHMGVMAQDFKAAFGFGKDDKTIDPRDAAGVAFKAIQELNAKIEALEKRVKKLEAQ